MEQNAKEYFNNDENILAQKELQKRLSASQTKRNKNPTNPIVSSSTLSSNAEGDKKPIPSISRTLEEDLFEIENEDFDNITMSKLYANYMNKPATTTTNTATTPAPSSSVAQIGQTPATVAKNFEWPKFSSSQASTGDNNNIQAGHISELEELEKLIQFDAVDNSLGLIQQIKSGSSSSNPQQQAKASTTSSLLMQKPSISEKSDAALKTETNFGGNNSKAQQQPQNPNTSFSLSSLDLGPFDNFEDDNKAPEADSLITDSSEDEKPMVKTPLGATKFVFSSSLKKSKDTKPKDSKELEEQFLSSKLYFEKEKKKIEELERNVLSFDPESELDLSQQTPELASSIIAKNNGKNNANVKNEKTLSSPAPTNALLQDNKKKTSPAQPSTEFLKAPLSKKQKQVVKEESEDDEEEEEEKEEVNLKTPKTTKNLKTSKKIVEDKSEEEEEEEKIEEEEEIESEEEEEINAKPQKTKKSPIKKSRKSQLTEEEEEEEEEEIKDKKVTKKESKPNAIVEKVQKIEEVPKIKEETPENQEPLTKSKLQSMRKTQRPIPQEIRAQIQEIEHIEKEFELQTAMEQTLHMTKKIKELENDNHTLNSQIDAVKRREENLKISFSNEMDLQQQMQQQLEEVTDENVRIRNEIEEYKARLEKSKEKELKLIEQLNKFAINSKEVKKKFTDVLEQNTNLSSSLKEKETLLESASESQKKKYELFKELINKKNSEISNCKRENEIVQSQMAALKEERDLLKEELLEVREENAKLKEAATTVTTDSEIKKQKLIEKGKEMQKFVREFNIIKENYQNFLKKYNTLLIVHQNLKKQSQQQKSDLEIHKKQEYEMKLQKRQLKTKLKILRAWISKYDDSFQLEEEESP